MRRRTDASELAANLTVFDGHRFRTSDAWKAAFAEFLAARAAWLQEHDGSELPPREVHGGCPFDHSRFRKSADS